MRVRNETTKAAAIVDATITTGCIFAGSDRT
jgi:hypothetical protein